LREYSRSATTIVNTQVGPVLKKYLAPLEHEIREMGFRGALLIMQGSGGCVRASEAPAHAAGTLGSVLTGGVVGCLHLGQALKHKNIISTDMGGTTFLVGLVVDGKPLRTTTMVLNQHQINMPMVDVHTIGAGGGAIAWIDGGGNLKVGPRSAGARPGPACYGEGGTEPTVTDADLVLGIINGANFLGGRKKLLTNLAEQAIEEKIGRPLGLSVVQAAAAIYAIQNAQTADLVRRVVINSGFDPRDFALYAFGGAGPVHAASYSADLGISEVVFPLGSTAAVFSAYGLAASDILLTTEQSQPASFPVDPKAMNSVFEALEAELSARLAGQGLKMSKVQFVREADVRYTAQIAEIATPVPNGKLDTASVEGVAEQFAALYERIFGVGTGYGDAGLQVITYRVRAMGALPIRPTLPELRVPKSPVVPTRVRQVLLDIRKGMQPTKIYDSRVLAAGSEIQGPAIIEAPTTTVAIPQGSSGVVDRLGNFVLRHNSPV
jgi:N-methylhydantoinase A